MRTFLLLLATVATLGSIGIGLISHSFALATESVSKYGIARQVTQQIETHETEYTERTYIEWDGRVRIAEIETGADERTSGWGLAHRGADGLRMAVSCLLALVIILFFLFIGSGILARHHGGNR